LVDYRQLLAPGGKMFGDDWDWAGVRAAVSIFARDHGLTITHCHDKWVLAAAG
jgi:putative intracellular protease/amidase